MSLLNLLQPRTTGDAISPSFSTRRTESWQAPKSAANTNLRCIPADKAIWQTRESDAFLPHLASDRTNTCLRQVVEARKMHIGSQDTVPRAESPIAHHDWRLIRCRQRDMVLSLKQRQPLERYSRSTRRRGRTPARSAALRRPDGHDRRRDANLVSRLLDERDRLPCHS